MAKKTAKKLTEEKTTKQPLRRPTEEQLRMAQDLRRNWRLNHELPPKSKTNVKDESEEEWGIYGDQYARNYIKFVTSEDYITSYRPSDFKYRKRGVRYSPRQQSSSLPQ